MNNEYPENFKDELDFYQVCYIPKFKESYINKVSKIEHLLLLNNENIRDKYKRNENGNRNFILHNKYGYKYSESKRRIIY